MFLAEYRKSLTYKSREIKTPLGPMRAYADDKGLYVLEFVKSPVRKLPFLPLESVLHAEPDTGVNKALSLIEEELALYFEGKLKEFKTPLCIFGTPFQMRAWEALMKIPYGETRSYLWQAKSIGNPKAWRTIALANAVNHIVIVIPCHRIINSNGALGGYSGGIDRKKMAS